MSHFSSAELAGRVAGAVLTDRPLRLVTRPCWACGGEITADAADPGEMVRRHNDGPRHLAWEWRSGAREEWLAVTG